MRGFNEIMDDVIYIIENSGALPIAGVKEYRGTYMDMPIIDPTVTVGVGEVTMHTGALRAYAGKKNGIAENSIPAEVALKTNIYVPKRVSGYVCYEVLTVIANALFNTELLDVTKIESGNMRYDGTFLCNVLPVTVHLRERMCGDTE